MGRTGKATEEESPLLWSLISDWKIDFESAITLDDWDARHLPSKHIFKQILEIKAITFAEYPREDHFDKEAAVRKKLLVRRLQANADQCKNEMDNEAGWVNNVANLVFESLNGCEFRCHVCNRYLWLPDFVASPADPEAAEQLDQDYRRRKICGCSPTQRAATARVRSSRPSIFSNKSDERVVHTSTGPPEVTNDQKYNRPDRVYGLSITASFHSFRNRLLTYSPFLGKHTLFPFLVVEAKSDKSSFGFQAILQQTAPSIHTCLKLQRDLQTESNQSLEPLVWFFGFRGDEWRLYVALPVKDRTKVLDCWHGCISNPDEALQLLLIVDWICFWARDVHRKAVLKCLSRLEARDITPAETVYSFQREWTAGTNTTRSQSLVFRSSRPAIPNPESNAQHQTDPVVIDVDALEDEIMQDALNNDVSAVRGNADGSEHDGDQSGGHAIRSALGIEFRWKYFALPEDEASMRECLSTMATSDSVQNTAGDLWTMLTDESSTVKISRRSISELLHSSMEQEETESGTEEPVTTFLACQRYLTSTSWQVTCTYWCITCSQPAAQLLAMMAAIAEVEESPLNLWRAPDCNCLVSAVADFRTLSGRASAAAAISREIYCIRPRTSGSPACHVEWCKGATDVVQRRVKMLERLFGHVENAQQTSLPAAALCTSAGDTLLSTQLFETDGLDEVPGVIIKKPEKWPAECPQWCFLTFEHGGWESIGRQIAVAHRQRAIYTSADLSPEDDQSILEWALATEDVMQSIDISNQ